MFVKIKLAVVRVTVIISALMRASTVFNACLAVVNLSLSKGSCVVSVICCRFVCLSFSALFLISEECHNRSEDGEDVVDIFETEEDREAGKIAERKAKKS